MKKENSIYVLLLDQGLLYLFMNVKIAKDGSIEVLFPNIKDRNCTDTSNLSR